MDIIFQNVKMYDGTGKNPGKICDVGVTGDKISAIGDLKNAEADRRIDCTGLTMIPGMIDVHTHSDLAMYKDPERAMALKQGITTEITSACGIGIIPLSGALRDEYVGQLEGLTGIVPPEADLSSVAAYFDTIPNTGVNVAVQISHSPLRTAAGGTTKDVPLTDEMWKKMEKLEREAFEQGAVSISTGLSYFPAAFCDYDEFVKLAKVANDYDAPFSVHRRDTFRAPIPGFNSNTEVLNVARDSGCKMVYSHFRTGPWDPGRHVEQCEPIERGIKEGLRISADFYPYDNGCTYLVTMFPFSWMQGGRDGLIENLNDPEKFDWFVKRMENNFHHGINGVFTYCPNHPEYLGKTFQEAAGIEGVTPEYLIAMMLRDEHLAVANVGGTEASKKVNATLCDDFAYFMTKPYYNVGSDTIPSHTFPHPRSYGAFAKVLRIALDHNIDMARFAECTSGSAAKLYNMKNRGEIREGYYADIAIFDEKTVNPKSTFAIPHQYAEGMKYVVVNGKLAVDNGELTGVRSGRPIRRGE